MSHKFFSMLFGFVCLPVIILLAAACSASPVGTPVAGLTSPSLTEIFGMPNPASVYCEEHGGVLELRQDGSGVCRFPDGSQCDEWAYFRGECMPGGQDTPPPPAQASPTPSLADYAFPNQIDPAGKYLIYLHGKIIEDQGLPAVSADFGEYQYAAILQKLSQHGLRVISEVRPKDTDPLEYAGHVAGQVQALLESGVPPENITVVGASKGGGIAIFVSSLVKNERVNYVPMAICSPETVSQLVDGQVVLYGNVLSIYDSSDDLSGSCADLFTYSEGKGLARHEEIVLQVGTGHGILYQPLDEWVLPVVKWAGGE